MESHLQTKHEDELSHNSLSTLLSWAAVQRMGIESCPLCSSSGPEDSPELVDHVLRHTYTFALQALPWPEPVLHDLNVQPGDFNLPEEPEQAGDLQKWIDEVPHEGMGCPKLRLCNYDRADHYAPVSANASEHSGYFTVNNYFGEMPEDRSCKPQRSIASSHLSALLNHYEPYYIAHVREKFPWLDIVVSQRLGRALTQRRRYFKSRENHSRRLQERLGLDKYAYSESEYDRTTVSSATPQHLSDSAQTNPTDFEATISNNVAEVFQGWEEQREGLPPLPKEHAEGPFLCPFCYMIISIDTQNEWK